MKEISLDKNLELLMKRYRFSLNQLARSCEVGVSSVHNWINGTPPKGLLPLVRMSNYFEISLDQLVFPAEKSETLIADNRALNEGRFEIIIKKLII